jgi:hypothetical protein
MKLKDLFSSISKDPHKEQPLGSGVWDQIQQSQTYQQSSWIDQEEWSYHKQYSQQMERLRLLEMQYYQNQYHQYRDLKLSPDIKLL